MTTRNNRKRRIYAASDLEALDGVLTLGQFLRSWRLCDEISQTDFARKLGISCANLCDIERGRKGISVGRAWEIAKIIGYSPTMLVSLALEAQLRAAGLDFEIKLQKRKAV